MAAENNTGFNVSRYHVLKTLQFHTMSQNKLAKKKRGLSVAAKTFLYSIRMRMKTKQQKTDQNALFMRFEK